MFYFKGVGYKLRLFKTPVYDEIEILTLIRKFDKHAYLESQTDELAVFNFNSDLNVRLAVLFEELEEKQKDLGIKSFGIKVITMEDVFMKLVSVSNLIL